MNAKDGILHAILGRLDWSALPFWQAVESPTTSAIINAIIATAAASLVVIGAVVVPVLITRWKAWGPLWFDWLTSLDHKKIGIMYVVLALIMLLRAIIEAVLMRTQQAFGLGGGFISPDHFGQLFSTHGSIMIYFMAMPFLTGLINYVMPLQIGARDVSFPAMNSISLGLTAAGAALVMVSLVLGPFSTGGWSGYPPYTEVAFNPGPGVDYWIWAVTLGSIGSTMAGINIAVTIYKERAPGMTFFRMPMFCWTALCTAILMIFAMPPLTVATALLALDRYLDFHFFTNDLGGNMMNYANLFWLFGHPEVYILVLPSFGIFSEIFAVFSGKTLYGYKALVWATMSIAVLSFTVWVHHFFTMGQSANLNAVFGIATMTIGIPTGVKVYDWILTMWRGRVRLSVPLVYASGFIMLFVIGGMTGIILANAPVDYQVHNTLFLVAHFHNMLVPGLLFGMLAGYTLWFPKAFGFRLDDRWGYISAFSWIGGFILAFFPLYALGLMGMPRRTVAFFEPAYLPWTIVAGVGGLLVTVALIALVIQLWVSVQNRERTAVPVGDPWDGRSLEWATSSPPPEYNFAASPIIRGRDAFFQDKQDRIAYRPPERYEAIVIPANSAIGPVIAAATFVAGFSLVWHMWWLALLSDLIVPAALIARGFARRTTRTIPADEVEATNEAWLAQVRKTPPVTRAREQTANNRGHSVAAIAGVVQ